VIDDAWAEHERLKDEGTICPFVFSRDGEEIRDFRAAWNSACKTAGCPGNSPMTCGGRECGHKTGSVFDRYDIVVEDDIRVGLGRLAAKTTPEQPSSPTVHDIAAARQSKKG
jgi:hypothetical protein